jgi:hypothetical protein
VKLHAFLTDPRLAGGTFNAPSFRAHRVVARLLDGDAHLLGPEEWQLACDLTGRTDFASIRDATEVTFIAARRGGKSLFAAASATHAAALDYRDRLAPGEWATSGLAAPNTRQAQVLLDYCRGLIEASSILRGAVIRETANAIEFEHRTRIEVFGASHRTLRGDTFAMFIIDEAAQLRSEESATPDIELARAVRPALATLGGRLLVISSPYMRRGLIFNAYRDHYGRNDSPHLVIKGDWQTLNPTLPADVIAAAFRDDPASARAEWGGCFRDDTDAAYADTWITVAVDAGVLIREPMHAPGTVGLFEYHGYADPAGGSGADSYCAAVSHREGDVIVLDALLEVRPPFNTDGATAQVAGLFKRYGITTVRGDRYGGSWPAQALAKHGITYQPCELATSDLYVECTPLFSSGRVRLLDHDRLATQLRQLERRVRPGGRDSITHPSGGHDDCATACAGALWLASRRATWTGEPRVATVALDSVPADGPTYLTPGDARLAEYDRRYEARRDARPWDAREGDSTWSAYEAERHLF